MFAGLIGCLKAGAPFWVVVLLAVLLCVTFAIYMAAYIYFAVKAPDNLRSEKYSLSKLAIERSVTGDNLSGFTNPALEGHPRALPITTPPEERL